MEKIGGRRRDRFFSLAVAARHLRTGGRQFAPTPQKMTPIPLSTYFLDLFSFLTKCLTKCGQDDQGCAIKQIQATDEVNGWCDLMAKLWHCILSLESAKMDGGGASSLERGKESFAERSD